MATAVLLCVTTISLAVLALVGQVARTIRPRRISMTIGVAQLLQVELELDASPDS